MKEGFPEDREIEYIGIDRYGRYGETGTGELSGDGERREGKEGMHMGEN